MLYFQGIQEVIKTWLKLFLRRGSFISFSQFGEDAIVHSLLRKERGYYIDVGAFHPTLYSNTYALYRLGWQGLVIDPNARMGLLFKILRPRDKFVECAVSEQKGISTYYEYEDGAYNSLSVDQVDALAASKNISPIRTRKVTIAPLSEILRSSNVTSIDVLSVDVEGLDLMVLKSHDWSMRPKIIIVEDHMFTVRDLAASPIYNYLVSLSYALEGLAGVSLIFKDSTTK